MAAAALATAPAAGADAMEIEQRNIEIAAVRDPQLGAQVAVAEAYGYFKEAGVEATVRWTQSGADIITFMAGGNQNIGTGGTFTQIVLAGQRLPVKTISALADIAGTQGFVLSPGVHLASPLELEGKKLAFTEGNSQVLILAKLAKTYGFDMKKVTLVNMNPSEGVVAASKGDVQGLLGWQPNLYRLIQMGGSMYATGTTLYVAGKPEKLSFADRLQYNHSLLLASQDWIDHKPNTLIAVLRALQKATELFTTDRAKALDALQTQLRIDAGAIRALTDANDYGLAITDSVAKSVEFQGDWARSIKRIPNPVTAEEVLYPKLLQEMDPKLVDWHPKHA